MWPFSSLIRDSAVRAEVEERSSIDFSAFADLLTPTYSGASVNQGNAADLPAVFKCWDLNSSTISSLPLDIYANRGGARVAYSDPIWMSGFNGMRVLNGTQILREFIAMTQVSLDADGNAFWLKISDSTGRLVGLEVMAPTAVSVEFYPGEGLIYTVQTIDQKTEILPPNAVVHLRGLTLPGQYRGLSPIQSARQTIGIGKSAEQFGAQFFGNGANLSGVIEHPGNPSQEAAERLKADFTKKHGGINKSHAIGILSGGAHWQAMSVKPEEAQFLESRRYTSTEIANLYGVPPELVSDVDGAKGYVTALSSRLRLWYITGLLPRITRIEEAFTGLLPRGVYAKFNTYALLRMDPGEQTSFFAAGQQGEYLTRNEIRTWLDMNPVDDGDEFLHSVQWQENAPPDSVPTSPSNEPASGGLSNGGSQ